MASTRVTASNVQITGILDMRNNQVTGLETDLNIYPLNDDDGASKAYVDAKKQEVIDGFDGIADNETY